MNTLCESEVLQHKVSDSPETAHLEEGIRIKPVNVGACVRRPGNGRVAELPQSLRRTACASR